MPTREPFRLFKRRFSRAYFVLAITIIVLVALGTASVAIFTFVSSLNDSIDTARDRVSDRMQGYQSQHAPITTYAKTLSGSEARPHVRIVVMDRSHRPIAGARPVRPNRIPVALGTLAGLQRAAVDAPDGSVLIVPDYDWFATVLERLLLVMLAIALVAAAIAWWLGRRITEGAIAPLVAVTNALNDIAAGNFVPQPVIEQNEQLRDLTTAYNSVAFTLRTATAEREHNELQMRQFIADAGHELRTPLTVVMGYLDALKAGVVRDPDGVSKIYETISGESRRMKSVIERLIFLARLERPSQTVPVETDVTDVVNDVISRLQPVAGDRLEYTHDGPVAVLADPAELSEGIKNVVDNALRYAPDSPVQVNVESDGRAAVVTVSDRGPGMNAVDAEHAFDRFYRGDARSNAEGSGLGLSIAKRAVERAGGRIQLTSVPGGGTTVTMTLPARGGAQLA